jgi:hypothetical protein
LYFHELLLISKTLTPRVCGGATLRSLELKIMPQSRRPHHARVSTLLAIYHDLLPDTDVLSTMLNITIFIVNFYF